jgi:hypothetical protein
MDVGSAGGGGRKRRTSRSTVSYQEAVDDEEEDDDDDDVPLASLKSPSPKKKNTKAKASATKKASKSSKDKELTAPAAKKKKSAPASSSKSSGSSDYASPSFALYGSGSKKGELIQQLLCRWWYAVTWPDPSALPSKPPQNYDTMDGFPGVYICTQGEEVGTIKDLRDKSKAPNFNNFAKMTSEELRDLLVKAIEEQKRQLILAEGKGTSTEKDLDELLKSVLKINPAKADREAQTVLKAAKLSLPE